MTTDPALDHLLAVLAERLLRHVGAVLVEPEQDRAAVLVAALDWPPASGASQTGAATLVVCAAVERIMSTTGEPLAVVLDHLRDAVAVQIDRGRPP